VKIPKGFNLPDEKYIISESDIVEILIAYNNQDYEWILYFFESLVPVQNIKKHFNTEEQTYTFDEVIKLAGITLPERG
jgi:hypothetical protein